MRGLEAIESPIVFMYGKFFRSGWRNMTILRPCWWNVTHLTHLSRTASLNVSNKQSLVAKSSSCSIRYYQNWSSCARFCPCWFRLCRSALWAESEHLQDLSRSTRCSFPHRAGWLLSFSPRQWPGRGLTHTHTHTRNVETQTSLNIDAAIFQQRFFFF